MNRREFLVGATAALVARPAEPAVDWFQVTGSRRMVFPVGGGGTGATNAAAARLVLIGSGTSSGPVCISAPPLSEDRRPGAVYWVNGARYRWDGHAWECLA